MHKGTCITSRRLSVCKRSCVLCGIKRLRKLQAYFYIRTILTKPPEQQSKTLKLSKRLKTGLVELHLGKSDSKMEITYRINNPPDADEIMRLYIHFGQEDQLKTRQELPMRTHTPTLPHSILTS